MKGPAVGTETKPLRSAADPRHERLRGEEGSLADITAVIESAKARGGGGALRTFVTDALPDSSPSEVEDVSEVALEIIESAPIFLARARQEAEARGLESVVLPLLERAEKYYLKPIDLLPEMTYGLPGLLDDAYLVLRTLSNLDRGVEPFLDWDLAAPLGFLGRLLGPDLTQKLDEVAAEALEDLSEALEETWARAAHRA